MLKIEVTDEEGTKFNIEAMSSGEKGLIVTFLVIAQSMANGGIVLLDEPELHLNPAVCSDVLEFLVEEYAIPNDLQFLICTHSPEILGTAFERTDCQLFHLRASNILTPVRPEDWIERGEAFKRLGASRNESLLYTGTVFVEGDTDREFLLKGFKNLFQRNIIRELGGRSNIELEIEALQHSETHNRDLPKAFFILDNDGKPTTLKSTETVRILQWKRRCVENYLLDFGVLTNLMSEEGFAATRITNVTEVQQSLKKTCNDTD